MYSRALSMPARSLGAFAAAAILSLLPTVSLAQSAPADSPAASCNLPVIDLANPMPGDMVLPGAYIVQGVALDPQAPQGDSGIDQVSLFLGDRDAGGMLLGMTQPTAGPHQNAFSITVSLPSSTIGEVNFVAYARSAISGKETEVTLPVVLGEDPGKTTLVGSMLVESSTNPGTLPASCATSEQRTQITSQPSAPAAQRTATSAVIVAPAEDNSGDGKP